MATKVFTGALIDFFSASGLGATQWASVVQPAWTGTDSVNGSSGTVTYTTTGLPNEQLFMVLCSCVDDATVPSVITMTNVRIEFNYVVTCSAATAWTNLVDVVLGVGAGGGSGHFDGNSDPAVYFGGTTRADLFTGLEGWAFDSMGASATQAITVSAYTVTITYTSPTSVISVTPSTGSANGGQAVTIRGTGFTAATGVTFGGIAATSVVIVDDFTITAVTPAHASGLVDVAVLSVATGTGLYTYVITSNFNLDPLPERTPIQQGKG